MPSSNTRTSTVASFFEGLAVVSRETEVVTVDPTTSTYKVRYVVDGSHTPRQAFNNVAEALMFAMNQANLGRAFRAYYSCRLPEGER